MLNATVQQAHCLTFNVTTLCRQPWQALSVSYKAGQLLRNAMGRAGYTDQHYECIRFNIIRINMGLGCLVSRKKHYVTFGWPVCNGLCNNGYRFLQGHPACRLILTTIPCCYRLQHVCSLCFFCQLQHAPPLLCL